MDNLENFLFELEGNVLTRKERMWIIAELKAWYNKFMMQAAIHAGEKPKITIFLDDSTPKV